VAGEAFQALTSRPAFRLLLGRENPRLSRDQIDGIYDASRSRATKRAALKLYRAAPEATLASPATALRPLDRPALVIWGTRDAYLPREQATIPAPGVPVGPSRTARRPWSLGDA
jgi:pimeloyl-ACP methyl ester carboxylesterase